MPEIGQISGQLLEDNLTREGDDLVFDNDLFYLDVTNRRIGAKSTTPYADLLVDNHLRTTNLIVDTQANLADLSIYGTTVQHLTDDIILNASNGIVYATAWKTTGGLKLNQDAISTINTNQDFNLYPQGTGDTNIYSNVEIVGSLRAKGTITFDGDLTFGDSNTDNVVFNADVNSDILPNINQTYKLGVSGQEWNNIYTKNAYAEDTTASSIVVNNITLDQTQGKSWYVATNGLDTNNGNHQSAPYATIKQALTVAGSGDTIFIAPGSYVEIFPLTVPVGVTVKGQGLRSVSISPTLATNTLSCFLLNGETTVTDLSIKDFYAPGYAFKFAPNFTVTSRSPYVQNISVITQGSVTSPTDPRGYLAGDAGSGALVDGSIALSTSKEASMLFHSVTMITPGVDSIVMTNGVRVEWLNCFTYYARTGLYAINGTSGFAGLATKFGAELRSINSASVYGRYGAWADGNQTLMYLVGHNFAYIGSNGSDINDPTVVIEGNQAVTDNDGEIYYQSTDQRGNVRVGDVFKINGETGAVSFVSTGLSINGSNSISFTNGPFRTYLDPLEVTTGNITFQGNTISSNSGGITFSPSSGNIVLNANILSIPQGNDTSLILSSVGEMRVNIDNNNFEGYAANGLVSLYAIGDSTRTTRITPELTPGADDQTIRMYSNNVLKVAIDTTKFYAQQLFVGDLHFNQGLTNRLTLNGNSDLTLLPTGVGQVKVKNFTLETDTITNTTSDSNIALTSTNNGYWKIQGGAVTIPWGDDSTRPANPEVGMQRYNPQQGFMEVWNGTAWVNASGQSDVDAILMEEIADFWALVIG